MSFATSIGALAALMAMIVFNRFMLPRGLLPSRRLTERGGAPLASVVNVQDRTHASMSTPTRRAWFVTHAVITISQWCLKIVDVLVGVLLVVFEVVGLLVGGVVSHRRVLALCLSIETGDVLSEHQSSIQASGRGSVPVSIMYVNDDRT